MTRDDDRPPPRPMGPPFWIALAAGLLFVLAGAAVAWLGPQRPARGGVVTQSGAALTAPVTHGKGAAPPTPHP